MGQPTPEQVNMMLRLYEMRREPRLREARDWFVAEFYATSREELMKKCPPGSKENTHFRMVISYWDMVASILNRGLMDDDLFFENSGEMWAVWDRVRGIVSVWREALKDPHIFEHLERAATRMEAWREKRAPGSTAAMKQLMEQMRQAQAAAKAAS